MLWLHLAVIAREVFIANFDFKIFLLQWVINQCFKLNDPNYLYFESAFRLSVVIQQQNLSRCPIRRKKNTINSQLDLEVKTSILPKARENVGDLVVIGFSLHLIGWESDAIFLDQSQNDVKQKESNAELISTLSWKLLW